MYLTDFTERALVDVLESLDTQLFERVAGLTLESGRSGWTMCDRLNR